MKIHIIGGGIIGLCSAWYLNEAGYEVTIIDKSNLSDGCSFGNAGMIVPSHFVPMATPGMIAKGVRWMFNPRSPFYIKPRLNLDLMAWGWQFMRSARRSDMQAACVALRDLSWLSKQLYQELAQEPSLKFAYEERGLMLLCKNAATFREEKETAERAEELGLKAQVLDSETLSKIETGTKTDVLGAVYYPEDAHLYPNQLMNSLIVELQQRGVQFLNKRVVTGFKDRNGKVTHILTQQKQEIAVDKLVIASGSWTPQVLKKLGIRLLLQDGKGYSFTLANAVERPRIPTVLCEAKVAITPMGADLRIGGTLEISNMNAAINRKRVEGIVKPVSTYFPNINPSMPSLETVWHGFRPCSPDGLPYIGKVPKYDNLIVANGHAMMGLSLGPATGKLVTEIIDNKSTSVDVGLFEIGRF